jgi:hypothetical protein
LGLSSWIKQKIEGDPAENKLRKEVKAEAKKVEQEAFHEHYKAAALVAAEERGKAKAIAHATKKSSGGGLLNTLGNIGENMNKASKGLVSGIEINPDGNSGSNPFNVQDPLREPFGSYTNRSNHKPKRDSLHTVDPFDIE